MWRCIPTSGKPVERRASADPVGPEREPSAGFRKAIADIREGWRFIFVNPVVRAVNLGLAAGLLGGAMLVPLGPTFAKYMNGDTKPFSLYITALGFGVAVGVGALTALQQRIPKERVFVAALFLVGVSILLRRVDVDVLAVGHRRVRHGLGAGAVYVLGYTLLQENTEDELRGRTFTTFLTLVRLCVLGALVLGPAISALLDPLMKHWISGRDGARHAGRRTSSASHVRAARGADHAVARRAADPRGVGRWRPAASTSAFREQPPHVERRPAPPDGRTAATPTGSSGGMSAGACADGSSCSRAARGSGKSTQAARLAERLDALLTREPGGTADRRPRCGRCCWTRRPAVLDARAEALLMAADRAQHVAEVIEPALAAGTRRGVRPLRRVVDRVPGLRPRARSARGRRAVRAGRPTACGPTSSCCSASPRRCRRRGWATSSTGSSRGRRVPRAGRGRVRRRRPRPIPTGGWSSTARGTIDEVAARVASAVESSARSGDVSGASDVTDR